MAHDCETKHTSAGLACRWSRAATWHHSVFPVTLVGWAVRSRAIRSEIQRSFHLTIILALLDLAGVLCYYLLGRLLFVHIGVHICMHSTRFLLISYPTIILQRSSAWPWARIWSLRTLFE